MEGEMLVRPVGETSRLEAAAEELEDVLEGLDLDREPAFAEAVVAAVSATEQARRLGVELRGRG